MTTPYDRLNRRKAKESERLVLTTIINIGVSMSEAERLKLLFELAKENSKRKSLSEYLSDDILKRPRDSTHLKKLLSTKSRSNNSKILNQEYPL